MPAPGPGGSWIDDFEGNKLSSKWVATRYSSGGQNDGVWTRQVKDSKIYWHPTGNGTEGGQFGEWISLPVNAPGDIYIEALVRTRATGGGPNGFIGIGINQTAVSRVQYGVQLNFPLSTTVAMYGTNNFNFTPWPARPSQQVLTGLGSDYIAKMNVNRKNGYMFLYINGFYVGQYAFAPVITTVDIYSIWLVNQILEDHWVEYLKVSPREVVK